MVAFVEVFTFPIKNIGAPISELVLQMLAGNHLATGSMEAR